MKKLLSMLLAAAMVVTLALTALPATEAEIPEISIDSEIRIDEYFGDSAAGRVEYFEEAGTCDVTFDGVKYENIRLEELQTMIWEQTGQDIQFRYYNGDGADLQPEDSPWNVGGSYTGYMTVGVNEEDENGVRTFVPLVEGIEVTFVVCATEVESIYMEPMTYYEFEADVQNSMVHPVVLNYKDGTTSDANNTDFYTCYFARFDQELPTEPGTYTLNATAGRNIHFSTTVEITVLPMPTSGKLGEDITWAYDETTETLTLSGTGATYDPLDDNWPNLFMYQLMPKHVVVSEGIEYLTAGIFHYGLSVESLSLPTTLKEIPDALIGWNGMDGAVLDGYTVHTMSSIVIPEGITSLTSSAFYLCSGISDYYLPSTLKEIDLDTLCYVAWCREEMELAALNTTIHFAGTEEQWAQVAHVAGSREYGTGLTDAELEELFATFTVVFEPKDEVKEEITVDNGTATIPDSALEITEGKDVVIDLTGETVERVVLDAATVEKIAEAKTAVEIALPEAAVSFDAAAVAAISDAAEGETVTIVVSAVEKSTLTDAQQKALAEENVCAVLKLEAYAGDVLISDFKGGVVTVTIPFDAAEGKTYAVAYVADDGTMTRMPTTCADGCLTFTTTHFSNYVVLESAAVTPPVTDNPQTGDNGMMLFCLLMVVSAAALVVCTAKRKAY